MAGQAVRPNPCAAFRSVPPPLPARRADAATRTKDAPCPTSNGDRGLSGQCKKPPEHAMHKPSGGTYTKPDARVKLIPAEDITYVRHGKPFGRTVGSAKLQKRHCRRSVTPPPSSRKISLARSTPLTHKSTTPFTPKAMPPLNHKASAPLTHKAATPLTHKPMTPPHPVASCLSPKRVETAHKALRPLSPKPTTPPLPVASCLSPKRVETAHRALGPLSPKPTTPPLPVASCLSPKRVEKAHKASRPLSPKPTTPPLPVASCLSPKRVETAHKASGPLSPKPSTPPLPVASCLSPKRVETAHKASGPLSPKPTTPPLPVASCLSPKRVETVENRQFFSLNRPSPLYKSVQRGAFPPSVLRKESEMNPINPSSVHVPPAYSRKVPLTTKAEPPPKSVITLDNKKLCSISNQAALKCQPTKRDADPIVEKETTVKLPLLSPTSVLSSSSTEVCLDTGRSSSRLNLFDGKSKLDSLQPETNIPQAKSPESTIPTPCAQLSDDLRVVSSTKSHVERQTNQEPSISRNMSSGAQLILHTPLCKETYQPEACWKGKFEITGELTHTCDGLEAYFPCEISSKVYEASKQMPEILKLEALPLSGLLPKKFKMEPPCAQDIGLCFISSCQRPNRDSYHLLENVSSHIGLRTDIGTVDLLIFSSKLLTEDDQTKDGELYLFGVFQKHTRKRQHRVDSHTDISNAGLSKGDCHISEDIGMDLDMIGGKYTKGKNREIGMKLDATEVKKVETSKPKEVDANAVLSNAAPAVSFFTGSCSPDSAGTTDSLCKSARRAPACGDLVLDPPPGFPLDVPPGFTRAHCGLRRGKTAESHIDSSPSLAFDTPGLRLDAPPGFTKAHGGLHTNDSSMPSPGSENGASTLFSEKKSPIKFSLNITRPPGFAKLAEVKKEPGLPAFFKATEKTPPIGKANEKDIKHDKVNVEVELDDSSEEREFPKTKRLSDILGSCASSSWRNNATTSAAPRNCSEVFRPATASKFEEQKQQHRHCRKRGQQEASKSDAAVEATKRLKVNGRIALNGCPALNSNQAQPKTPPT
ncbi:titin-like isoform X2 [Triticum dicoccoides]|uniref:titin-like isoform X2 n=1 Tax=Triticum dicoccoides TaxID=85692 RepID=UPI00188E7F24|nr:titin-like isoform X2 [Triticum dicoccoides]